MISRKLAASLLYGAFVVAGCGASNASLDEVGPNGGTVESADTATAGASLTVPANATATTLTVTFAGDTAAPALPAGYAAASAYVIIGPAGTTFTAPVTITLPTTDATASVLFTRAGGTGDWTMVPNAHAAAATNSISGDVTTLGEFVAAKAVLACQSAVPASNYCSMESCNFRPLSLPQCDNADGTTGGDTNYDFYNPDYCSNQLTLLVVAAGWCNPCMQEAPMIEQLVTQQYAGRVRVVSVMFQNADFSTPTCSFAMGWRQRFGLTSHMLIDPHGDTQVYYPSMAFPANLLINGNGQIVYRQYGTSSGLSDLQQAIENNLNAL